MLNIPRTARIAMEVWQDHQWGQMSSALSASAWELSMRTGPANTPSPDSDNNHFADGGQGEDGVVAKWVAWISPYFQRLQGAHLNIRSLNSSLVLNWGLRLDYLAPRSWEYTPCRSSWTSKSTFHVHLTSLRWKILLQDRNHSVNTSKTEPPESAKKAKFGSSVYL